MNIKKSLILEIQSIIAQARSKEVRSVNYERVLMYWQIGKVIYEEEQDGKDRAEYGTFLIKSLANELQPQFGSGFSVRQLYRYVQLFRTFPIVSTLRTQFSWSHYKLLLPMSFTSPKQRKISVVPTV